MFSWNQIAGYTKGMAAIASHQVADWMQMESSLGRPWPGPPLGIGNLKWWPVSEVTQCPARNGGY
jgi:hypothetical protein